ncbi:DUF3696 domain-containing protein [Nocardia caishijiensis]|uniref:ATPase n=1 Tax=Nocardia caishijiensis TaxID=184756 RepID=A0ABQ6YFT5_9NOCA|nr:DUF3696 domain-containing protein [Nocardia caishijiensis]KAF0842484.1 putative ATPase [Nocardia caishijiensis]
MLTSILLRNFKAFAEIEIPLSRLTLLTGLNSSGKSTVLQALALLRQAQFGPGVEFAFALNGEFVELGLGRDVRHEAWIKGTTTPGAIEIELRSDLNDPDNELRGRAFWSAEYAAEEDLLRISRNFDLGSLIDRDDRRLDRDALGRDEKLRRELDRDFRAHETIDRAAFFQYLRADRINPAVSYLRSTAVQHGFLGARGEHAVNYLRIHQDDEVAEDLRHSEAVSNTLLRQTEAWLGYLCPGVNLQATGIDGTDAVRLSYSQGTGGLSSSNRYRPTNVGFGLTYALPIVIACLTARPGSLILLENPEAHLHPRGQSAMAQLIARAAASGAQLIVESHSDHVLNGLRIAVKRAILTPKDLQLLYFRTDDVGVKHVDPIEVRPSGSIENWPPGFFDEWDHALDVLID